jgi:quinol-cytochrome oxidoreductase complex cytochrome b subunit
MKETIISVVALVALILILTPMIATSPREEGEKEIYQAAAKSVDAGTDALKQDTKQAATWPIITLLSISVLTIIFALILVYQNRQQSIAMQNVMYIMANQSKRIEIEPAPWLTKNDMCLFNDKNDKKRQKETHVDFSQAGI